MALPVLDEEELLPPLPESMQRLWPHQVAPVRRITEMFQQGAKMVVLDAPPGAGKSLIAESVRRNLRCQALYLCQTKQLQGQIAQTFPYARVIKGRDNYPTLDDLARTAKDCDSWRKGCRVAKDRGCQPDGPHCSYCHPMVACPYMLAKQAALWSPLAVANTAYAFLEWGAQGQFKNYPLVILDEWDQVEDVLFNTLNVTISVRELTRFGVLFPQEPVDENWVRWTVKAVAEMYSQLADNPPDDWPRIGELLVGLRRAADGLKDRSWIVLGQDAEKGVSIGPIEVGKLGQQYLWPHGQRWLLMSATAIDVRLRLEKLGWTDFGPKGLGRILRVPSVYPVANRPVRVWPVAPMIQAQREASLPKMIVAIEKILNAHPDERVLIHSGTYAIAASLEAGLFRYTNEERAQRSRIVTFTRARDREDALARYLARERSVLIGPAMERGVDLPDDACRVVVIMRVPYPFRGDPRVAERSKQGGPWWVLQAIETTAALIQMTGRGMRHKDDTVTSYILDAQFVKIRRNQLYTNRWPTWWAESLVDFTGEW
jgi:ATP-dependent DNA helicase DinG